MTEMIEGQTPSPSKDDETPATGDLEGRNVLAQHGEDIGKSSTVDLTKLAQNDFQLLCQSDKGL
jgi:hypothetical protein